MGRRVAVNLRERRKARNMSLDQLAVASGVSRAALSQIETQKSNPSLGVMWKIAVGLGIPFSELLGGNTRVRRFSVEASRRFCAPPTGAWKVGR